jgi:hypothetical protein
MKKLKNFDLIFPKPIYGWSNFVLKSQNRIIFDIHTSGVYNPYYELARILVKLSNNNKQKQILEIDSEGLISTIEFSFFSINMIKIHYICESSRKKLNKNIVLLIPKNLFFKEFKIKMFSYAKKYNRLIENYNYDLTMPIKTIKNIKYKK